MVKKDESEDAERLIVTEKSISLLLKNTWNTRRFTSLIPSSKGYEAGKMYSVALEQSNREILEVLAKLDIVRIDTDPIENTLIGIFSGDTIQAIFDRLECRKPIIRKPTLEKISVQLVGVEPTFGEIK